MTLQERLDRKTDKSGGPDACWPWLGYIQDNGYGSLWNGERPEQVHRIAFRLAGGVIPEGKEIDHECRNRACANPKHVRAVTHQVNMACSDSVFGRNARKTECWRGHPLSGDNLRLVNGTRQCRECCRIRAAKGRAKRKANA